MDLEMPKELKLKVRDYLSPKHKMAADTLKTKNGKADRLLF
jgi:hypothetical protein